MATKTTKKTVVAKKAEAKKDIKKALNPTTKAKLAGNTKTADKAQLKPAETLVAGETLAFPKPGQTERENKPRKQRDKLEQLLTLRIGSDELQFLVDRAKMDERRGCGAATIAREVLLNWIAEQKLSAKIA